jgi:hypothetical protein
VFCVFLRTYESKLSNIFIVIVYGCIYLELIEVWDILDCCEDIYDLEWNDCKLIIVLIFNNPVDTRLVNDLFTFY